MTSNDLSPEDDLCLNVLMTEVLQAVRIDESGMTVHALTPKGEASVALHPNCKPEQYCKRVRELFAARALGQPMGYPVYLARWTRMGQLGDDMLEKLLLTGEPEAVTAVMHAPGITDEIARRAWWALPDIENACVMLAREPIARGEMGAVLTDFLVEHLPFVQESRDILAVERVLLQAGRLTDEAALRLWRKGRQKSVYLLGFLEQRPDALPEASGARRDSEACRARLDGRGGAVGAMVAWALSGPGQSFVAAADEVLRRIDDQETAAVLLDVIGRRFALPGEAPAKNLESWNAPLPEYAGAVLEAAPDLAAEIRAVVSLSRVSEELVRAIFARTTAVGAFMRTKIAPVADPIRRQLAVLLGRESA
jgi:hypothetical protein